MKIVKFSSYNESKLLPITDIVIDEKGNVYNGDFSPINKGRIEFGKEQVIKRIVGDKDGLDYPLGIDKNGKPIILFPEKNTGRALDREGNPIPVLPEIKKKYKISDNYYYKGSEYFQLLSVLPTGWVNVKIDMEIVKRVRKYSKSIGTNNQGHLSFISKLKEFERLSKLERKKYYSDKLKRVTIQKELSCILMLHHINEIKDFFNPSQSGFLFESFIAGLIPDSRVREDNSKVDIRAGDDRYQLKFYDNNRDYASVTLDADSNKSIYLEYYMIALKYFDKVELYIIDGRELENQLENGYCKIVTAGMNFSISSIKKSLDNQLIEKVTLDLSNIDNKIKNLGENIKESITSLYEEISRFNYNVDAIITGVDKNGQVIKNQDGFNVYHDDAKRNLRDLSDQLEKLVSDINR